MALTRSLQIDIPANVGGGAFAAKINAALQAIDDVVPVSLSAYGGKGDTGTTDNLTPFNNAVTALGATGGTIVVPLAAGSYDFSGRPTLAQKVGLTVRGVGAPTGGAAISSWMRFTGTGSGAFLPALSTNGVHFLCLYISASDSTFSGPLIDYSHDPALLDAHGSDSQFGKVEDCVLNAGPNGTSVYLDKAIATVVRDTSMIGQKYGIKGMGASGSYSNAIGVFGNAFVNTTATGYSIYQPGQGWDISGGNAFEGRADGTAGSIYSSYTQTYGTTIQANWFGDVTGGGDQITLAGQGNAVLGNYISGSATARGLVVGNNSTDYLVAANVFVNLAVGVAFGTNTSGMIVEPNTYSSVTAQTSGTPGLRSRVEGARYGHDVTRGTAPSVAFLNLGSGASVTVIGDDQAGTITAVVGAGATAGAANITLTWAIAYPEANGYPRVFLQPVNDLSVVNTPRFLVTGASSTACTIGAAVNPAAGTYSWNYLTRWAPN